MRRLTYAQAIREAFEQLLVADPRVFVIGQGLWNPWYVGATMQDLDRTFGRDRIIDTPVSENATTGAAIGAALAGMRPIVVHPRMDFMLLAMDPIVNQAANWSYMFGGQIGAPVVIRSIINRGGEQGAQHSQALQAFFLHVPGIKVVMPASPFDAKGLLIAAVRDGNPVLYIDDRWLYGSVAEVPSEMYEVPIGRGIVRRQGSDVTIVASSWMVGQALAAAETLHARDVEAEVIDLRSIKPWDRSLVFESVRKTGRLVVADSGWTTGGVAAEISAAVACEAFHHLKGPIQRVALPDAPAPTSAALERIYYPTPEHIIAAVDRVLAPGRVLALQEI
jgi:pyruvate/2-oxoglutarate/acetoin dehydrogenase E1 component